MNAGEPRHAEQDRAPIVVNSTRFEYVYVANQRCPCGGRYRVARQALKSAGKVPLDHLWAVCEACGEERDFWFDVSSFFGDPDRYGRYEQTEEHFRQAAEQIRAEAWPAAERSLRRVLDAEAGEPAFAWAHYHLGMVLLAQERLTEARQHLERAVAIQPLEPAIHRALGRTYQALDRGEKAEAHLREAEALRRRFPAEP